MYIPAFIDLNNVTKYKVSLGLHRATSSKTSWKGLCLLCTMHPWIMFGLGQ